MAREVDAQRRIEGQGRRRRCAPPAAAVQRGEEGQDALQHAEQEAQQPHADQAQAEPRREPRHRDLQHEGQRQHEAGHEPGPADAHQRERAPEFAPHAAAQRLHHQSQMQADGAGAARTRDRDALRCTRGASPRRKPASASAAAASPQDASCSAFRGRVGEREHRHQDVGQPERQQPHEAVGREQDVHRQRVAARRRQAQPGAGEGQRPAQQHEQRRHRRPAVHDDAGHAARAAGCAPSAPPRPRGRAPPQRRPPPSSGGLGSPCRRRAGDAGRVQPPDRGRQTAPGAGRRVATGSSCAPAPMALMPSTPSVIRCSAASGQPRPPPKRGHCPHPPRAPARPADGMPPRRRRSARGSTPEAAGSLAPPRKAPPGERHGARVSRSRTSPASAAMRSACQPIWASSG